MPKYLVISRKRRDHMKKLKLQNEGRRRSSALVAPAVEPSVSTTRHEPVPATDTSTMPKYIVCSRRKSQDLRLLKLLNIRRHCSSALVEPSRFTARDEPVSAKEAESISTSTGSSAVKQESAIENNSVDEDAVKNSSVDATLSSGVKPELLENEVPDVNLRPVCGMPILSNPRSMMKGYWRRPLSSIGTDDVAPPSLAPAMVCPNTILRSFIAIYESLPQLWDVTNKSYRSQFHRNEGMDKLLQIYRKWKPDATRDDVRKKISSLRATFRNVLKKIELSKLSGTGSDQHKATSWTFSALQFLTKVENFHRNNNETSDPDIRQTFPSLKAAKNQPRPSKRTKSSTTAKQNELLDRVYDLLSRSQRAQASSPVDPLAAHWTQKLQKLNPAQRIYAEKAIHDILFEAELNNLHRHSVQINNISASSTLYPNMSPVLPAHVIKYPIHKHGLIPKSLPDNTMECVSSQTPRTISTLPQSSSVMNDIMNMVDESTIVARSNYKYGY